MKKYCEYMDGVSVSDTLHQRLLSLEPPRKRPVWTKYGTIAAALLLVCGLGAWGIRQGMHTASGQRYVHDGLPDTNLEELTPDANAEPGVPDVDLDEFAGFDSNADIALVEPGDMTPGDEPGMKTIGGYDVLYGSGPNAVVGHYVLPYIEYGDAGGVEVCLDWDVPMGAVKKDLARDEIIALMGGADVVSDHLDWGEYQLSGWAAWYEDGSFWGAFINGTLIYYGGPANQFEFAVTTGALPPTCCVYPNSVTQEIRGLTVTADKCDWEREPGELPSYIPRNLSERRVSFMKDNYGCRFEMTSASPEEAEEMVSRLVARIADTGLALGALSSDGAEPAHPWEADPNYSVGEPNWEDGAAMTQPCNPDADSSAFDPPEAAGPFCNAP